MADTYSSRALLTGRELRRIRQRALDVPAAGRRGASWRHESGTMPAPLAHAAAAKALEAAARPPVRVLSPSTKPPPPRRE